MRPSDFGIHGVRAKNFRFGYGEPVPAEIKSLPRTVDSVNDADHWQQPALPTMPFNAEQNVRDSGLMGFYHDSAVLPDHLDTLHHTIDKGFAAAGTANRPGYELLHEHHRKGAQSTPAQVTQPTHEAQFGDYVLSRHESPGGDVIRAWDRNGNHVGGLQFSNPGYEHPGRITHDRIYVMPEHQGRGLAAAMSRFGQFTHSGDPIRGVGISTSRTSDGDRFTEALTDGKAREHELSLVLRSQEDFDREHDALVDPNNDPTARARAEKRTGKQLHLFE